MNEEILGQYIPPSPKEMQAKVAFSHKRFLLDRYMQIYNQLIQLGLVDIFEDPDLEIPLLDKIIKLSSELRQEVIIKK